MFNRFFGNNTPPPEKQPKEGELYKTVTVFGKRFELRYGYYEEGDRRWGEPDVLYPDFLKEPLYTDRGEPFVTALQDACESYKGEARTVDSTCAECEYFKRGEELFGLCKCIGKRIKQD